MELTVKTTAGLVRGTEGRHGTFAFRGIPFAAPPVGTLRFQPPARPEAWEGIRDCSEFGEVAPQISTPMDLGQMFDSQGRQGPDCLNLNVWTPDPGAAGLPVLVWIHGGAFVIGSGSDSLYDGSSFARDGVVCVTINYRLGAAGFLHVGDDVRGTGCFGILDQIAALEWVQENIAAFGGDPARVTVAGESAGGMSVGCLLGAPAAKGLFRRAIPQSGAASNALPKDVAGKTAADLLARLDSDASDLTDEELVRAQAELSRTALEAPDLSRLGDGVLTTAMAWTPMAGGDVLPDAPIDAIRAGSARDVDVLVGTTRDEMMLFLAMLPSIFPMVDAVLPMVYGLAFKGDGTEALDCYRTNRPGAEVADLLGAVVTDQVFRIPAIRLAEAQVANGANTWSYLFSWESPAFDGKVKAGHALELPFMWDNLDDDIARLLTGGDAPQSLADEVHGTWVRFVTDGDPGWAPYDLDARTTRQFGGDERILLDPMGDERKLWEGVA
jgi:para-nitrobenzyl esterase